MKLGLKFMVLITVVILLVLPLGIYSTVLEENNITQNNTTLLNVPDVVQPNNYSGGPTALQAVLAYYGTDISVTELINMTNTTENGTTPDNIALAAQNSGFTAEVKENLTLQDLQNNINQGTPIIVLCQAGKDNTALNWTEDYENGQYLVVVGMDSQNVYFEDPTLLGSKGYIPLQEFLERWHDLYINPQTGNNTTVNHLGIIITGGQPVSFAPFIKID